MTTTTTTAPPATTTTTAAPIERFSADLRVTRPTGVEIFGDKPYYRLRVEIVAAENLPTELFVFQRQFKPGSDPEAYHDDWYSIAGPVDLVDVPANTPGDGNFLRKSTGDVLLNNIRDVDAFEAKVKQALQFLTDGMARLHRMDAVSEYTVGTDV